MRSGDYRVNFPNADDSAAYYTDNLKTLSTPQWRWPERALMVRLSAHGHGNASVIGAS